jgi:hypothetical protein
LRIELLCPHRVREAAARDPHLPFSYTHHLPAATVRQHGEFLDVKPARRTAGKFLFDKVSVALKSLIISSEIYISNPSAMLRTGKSLFIAF